MDKRTRNFFSYFLITLLTFSFYSCEKSKFEDERNIAQEQLNGTWIISKIETIDETVTDNGDNIEIEVWDKVNNGNNGTISLSIKNIIHIINIGKYGVSGGRVINIGLDVDWTSSLLSHNLYSNFNTHLEMDVNSKQLVITKNLQTNDGLKWVLTIYASKR